MKPVLLKEDIFWVGAIDFNLRNFHHYSESPQGSTYNAYLIKDEKNVLIDTVSAGHDKEMLSSISEIIDPTKIDYIICNHLEKDHSGCLDKIVEICKPEKIFCSTLGAKYMRSQFDTTDWPIQTVKDMERINIGKRNITFLETRMLHWPDSMFSYVEEDKVLFSNDAFGQNVATSYHFVDEYPRPFLLKEMKDYYYNIILPYSPLVLKLLDRVTTLGLSIDVIAPDHGLIFRTQDDINFLLESYKELATQPVKQKAVIVYETLWGATTKMAHAIAEGLDSVGIPFTMIDLQKNHCSVVMNELADASALIVGSSTRNNMPLTNVIGTMAHIKGLKPQNLVGASFGSYAWSGEAPNMLTENLKEMGVEVVCDPVRAFFGPNDDDFQACVMLGQKVGEALKAKAAV